MLSTSVPLDREGFHAGYIDVPASMNHSAWSNQRVPIFSIKNGAGPCCLLLGGSHGDEYEGPIALSHLVHEDLRPEDIQGQVIVLPALNTPAVQAGARLSPLDGGNMNRAFPGNPRGTITERIADFVSRELIPRCDVVVDLHSGGRSLNFIPCAFVPVQKTDAATQEIMKLADAFDAPLTVIIREPSAAEMIDTEVERQGKRILATELGGSALASASTVSVTHHGLHGVLHAMGIVAEKPVWADAEAAQGDRQTLLVDGLQHYTYADETGIYECSYELGAYVEKDQRIGYLHFADRVERPPLPVTANTSGVLFCTAGQGLVQRGDALAVVGHVET